LLDIVSTWMKENFWWVQSWHGVQTLRKVGNSHQKWRACELNRPSSKLYRVLLTNQYPYRCETSLVRSPSDSAAT
jgi:hypothetical protein